MDGPNAKLTGNAVGAGTDTFRFAGAGSNAFDATQIGTGWTLIDKTGSSNWTLNGTSTTTAAVTVNGGTLSLNGNLSSTSGVTVNAGGTLGGNGTVSSTIINAGGTLSPGNSIGTINISGNLSFVGAGNYIVEVNRYELRQDHRDRHRDARRHRAGRAADAADDADHLYDPERLASRRHLRLGDGAGRQQFRAQSGAGLRGRRRAAHARSGRCSRRCLWEARRTSAAVAGGIDNAITAGNTLSAFDPLFAPQRAQLPGALDQLSGEVHASDRERAGRREPVCALRDPRPAAPGELWRQHAAWRRSRPAGRRRLPRTATRRSTARSPMRSRRSSARRRWQRRSRPRTSCSGRRALARGAASTATAMPRACGAISRASSPASTPASPATAASASRRATPARRTISTAAARPNVETGHIAGYGGWSFGAVNLRAGGDFAFHSISTDRTINFPGFFDRTFANYDGHTGQIFGELGYGFALANIAVEPFAGAAWVRVKTDAAAERGGAAALNFAGTTFETGYTTLGIRAAGMVPIGHDMILIPRASLAWQHAFDDVTPNAVLAFQAAPAIPFTIAGVPIARDALLAEAGLDLAIGRNATVGVSYTGQIARNVRGPRREGQASAGGSERPRQIVLWRRLLLFFFLLGACRRLGGRVLLLRARRRRLLVRLGDHLPALLADLVLVGFEAAQQHARILALALAELRRRRGGRRRAAAACPARRRWRRRPTRRLRQHSYEARTYRYLLKFHFKWGARRTSPPEKCHDRGDAVIATI